MPGIDQAVACHRLNANPDIPPKAQRQRKLSPHLREKVNAEIDRMKEVGFIREAKYTTWLANIVPVAKPNGKVRICIDFTNLNDACPKDGFPLPNMSMMDGNAGYN
ncbi:hypothetical protein ACHQM5_026224 [Ranunculus cassubicifolius]